LQENELVVEKKSAAEMNVDRSLAGAEAGSDKQCEVMKGVGGLANGALQEKELGGEKTSSAVAFVNRGLAVAMAASSKQVEGLEDNDGSPSSGSLKEELVGAQRGPSTPWAVQERPSSTYRRQRRSAICGTQRGWGSGDLPETGYLARPSHR
jgi:hypothetical protein